MSGIVGIINTDGAPVDRDLLGQMTDFMSYRGPDAQKVWVDGHVGFGHTMLRTTDEQATEHQPFTLDGKVWITADARVDARADLISALESAGTERLDGVTDVELILRAYRAWDTSCVDHLLGDFAFAIWDDRMRRLVCARDHFGVKPFFYARVGGALIFSNTLNCLRLHPDVSDELNEVAIGDFLIGGWNQDSGSTTFSDIRRVAPANYLTWSSSGLSIDRYWSLPTDGHIRYKSSSEYVEHFKELLETAVDDRLRTNHVAVEMSGGLDSPSIAATAKEILSKRGEPYDIQAHTVVYDRLIPDQERHYSGLAAEALGLPINYLVADDYPVFERTTQANMRQPEPFYVGPQSELGRDLLARMAASSRVALTGWDGDALLCDSPRFYLRAMLKNLQLGRFAADAAWYLKWKHALPPLGVRTWLRRKLGKSGAPSAYPAWLNPSFASRIDLPGRWRQLNEEQPSSHPTRPMTSRMLSVSNWWFLFESYDPGVTGLALEARFPLIDLRLVNYVLAIPPLPWCIEKHILRVAMANVLPEAVRHRAKSPLAGDPVVEHLRDCDSHWLDQFESSADLSRYVARGAVPRVSGEMNSEALWMNLRPFSLNRWLENSFSQPEGVARAGVEKLDRCVEAV